MYPPSTPNIADAKIIIIGWHFLYSAISIIINIINENKKEPDTITCWFSPLGKKAFLPTDITAAPINPTTAGFNPLMSPFTIALSLNAL